MPKRSTSTSVSPNAKRQKQASLTGFFVRTNLPFTEGRYTIFCDLDGVLCDFDAGVKRLCNGQSPRELPKGYMWNCIANTEDFYCDLPWMRDGRALWDAIRPLQPNILTGVPKNRDAREQKATWCQRELGVPVNHVDMAGSKSTHCIVRGRKWSQSVREVEVVFLNTYIVMMNGAHIVHRLPLDSILIDDNEDLKEKWESRGGIFVHHTDTERTLRKLKEHGILSNDSEVRQSGVMNCGAC